MPLVTTLRAKDGSGYRRIETTKIRLTRMRRRVGEWARVARKFNDAGYRIAMITLTYAEDGAWAPNHIRDYLVKLRSCLGKSLQGYAWVAELTERGRVHYHLLVAVTAGTDIPEPDTSGMWVHGWSQRKTARSVFYVVSYLKKAYHGWRSFPRGLRLYAVVIYARAMFGESEKFNLRLTAYSPRVQSAMRYLAQRHEDYDVRAYRVKNGWMVETSSGLDELYIESLFEYVGTMNESLDISPRFGVQYI